MAHTGWCTSNAAKKVLEKVRASIVKTFSGTGDPEVYDCPHVIDHMAKTFGDNFHLKSRLENLFQQVRQIDPTWVPPAVDTQVPAAPAALQVKDGWLWIWCFGKTDDAGIKGRSNMVNVLEVAFSILENTFNSAQQPVDVLFHEPPGDPIPDFSIQLSVGFTRILAVWVVLTAMMDLEAAGLAEVVPVLCSLFSVRYTYNPASSDSLQRFRSLAAKFQVSESTRPDPIQMFNMFSDGLRLDGIDVATGLPQKIKDYNAMSSIQSQNISDLEGRVICALPFQTPVFLQALKYHWQNYKNQESAVPMKLFSFINADIPVEATGVWKEIMSPSPSKNELFIQFLIGVFVKNFKDTLRMKKKVNLRFQANKLRVPDPTLAYRQCCLWVHFRPQMQAEMSAAEYTQMEKMFCRAAFERELADRVKAMNPTLCLQDFRFFYSHLGRDQPMKDDSQLNASQEEAELQQEQASLCFSQSMFVIYFSCIYIYNLDKHSCNLYTWAH